MCGVKNAKSTTDLNLSAKFQNPTTINLSGSSALQYTEGSKAVRKYDSCYYQISSQFKNGHGRLLRGKAEARARSQTGQSHISNV